MFDMSEPIHCCGTEEAKLEMLTLFSSANLALVPMQNQCHLILKPSPDQGPLEVLSNVPEMKVGRSLQHSHLPSPFSLHFTRLYTWFLSGLLLSPD